MDKEIKFSAYITLSLLALALGVLMYVKAPGTVIAITAIALGVLSLDAVIKYGLTETSLRAMTLINTVIVASAILMSLNLNYQLAFQLLAGLLVIVAVIVFLEVKPSLYALGFTSITAMFFGLFAALSLIISTLSKEVALQVLFTLAALELVISISKLGSIKQLLSKKISLE